ncbi:hypothetical protein [Bacillus wiedmannii]|uniref:hypothetical protein n=1 Tax=Bacillus wiedmannii TaxID=1890302 RepID=UPI000B43F92B|nr:hypothetical protein BK740_04440 [Bacillus thuringiensis serovar argentinensis]
MCNRYENDYDYYNDGCYPRRYRGGCRDYRGYGRSDIAQFLRTLSPGTCIVIQYDSQRPVRATFQEIRGCTLLVSDIKGFPHCSGFTHIALNRINAVSILSSCPPNWEDCEND